MKSVFLAGEVSFWVFSKARRSTHLHVLFQKHLVAWTTEYTLTVSSCILSLTTIPSPVPRAMLSAKQENQLITLHFGQL